MEFRSPAVLVTVITLGCAPVPSARGGTAPSTDAPATRSAPHAPVLPFVADGFPAALETARASRRPIFIEAWAPW